MPPHLRALVNCKEPEFDTQHSPLIAQTAVIPASRNMISLAPA